MKYNKFAALFSLLLHGLAPEIFADDPLPEGVIAAIRNENIPIIVDASVIKFNEEGHGEIKVHTIYKPGKITKQEKSVTPLTLKKKEVRTSVANWIRGYGLEGSDKIAPLRLIINGKPGRFLFFLDGDLLYSTYNNQFPIREAKSGSLEVGTAFNGSGGPWKPLKEVVKLIPKRLSKKKSKE
ncbi:MAG: hypothetical protein VYC70_08625 [Verrucomicrobiota bacterium]|nr:hypothetical protein [Verrucomicrobiota bacterium]